MQTHERHKPPSVLGTATRIGLLAVLAVTLWTTAPNSPERVMMTVMCAVMAVGVAAQYGAPPRGSRLPPAAQGVLVGTAVGATLTVALFGALQTWGLLFALLALPSVFPDVVPKRWRHLATATWSDLAVEAEPTRTGSDAGGPETGGHDRSSTGR